MRRLGMCLLLAVMGLGLAGCPSKGGGTFNDPDAQRERAGKAQSEMHKDMKH